MFPFNKAMALLNLYPDALWSVTLVTTELPYRTYTLHGRTMKGFILPSDQIHNLRRVSE